jgi:hypothetical protein
VGQVDRGPVTQKPKQPGHYEITAIWQSPEVTQFNEQMIIPGADLKAGNIYRVRCRMKDSNGRWSHWSEPVEFTPSAAKS